MTSLNLRRRAAQTWLNLLYWHAEHAPSLAMAIKPIFVWGAWTFSRSIRAGTRANISRLLGDGASPSQRDALAREVVGNFYRTVVEFGNNRRRTNADLAASVDSVLGEARYLEARRTRGPGCGAIFVTAHLGSFEVAMAMLRTREPRVHVVFRRDAFPLFERLRAEQHARLGVIEAAADEGLATWVKLRDALAADDVVLMQADRVMPDQPGVTVPFLGGHTRVPSGSAKLARLTGAPLIPVFAINTGCRRVRIEIGEPIWTQDFPLDSMDSATIDPVILLITGAVERVIRENPAQWLRLDPALLEDEPSHDQPAPSPNPDLTHRHHRHGPRDLARPHA